MNPYDQDQKSKETKEKGQFDEIIDNIKQTDTFQKINNHEFTAKVKTIAHNIVDEGKKAIS